MFTRACWFEGPATPVCPGHPSAPAGPRSFHEDKQSLTRTGCAVMHEGCDETVGTKEPSFNMESHHGRLMRHHSTKQLHTANVNYRKFPSVH
jgi:hypothetical protein